MAEAERAMSQHLRTDNSVRPHEVAQLLARVSSSTRSPLSEASLLALKADPPRADTVSVGVRNEDSLVGYGIALPQPSGPFVAELSVVAGAARSHVTDMVLAELQARTGNDIEIWAHGRDSGLATQLQDRGWSAARDLRLLGRDTSGRPLDSTLPAGYHIRPFRPGLDEAAFLEANRLAFEALPDQGGWRASDLSDRLAQPWFDPEGFLLLIADDASVAGFHWTKTHPADAVVDEPHGEVYVMGLLPRHQGRGLASPLLSAGIDHLRSLGMTLVILYVDAANRAAMATYTRAGFVERDRSLLMRTT